MAVPCQPAGEAPASPRVFFSQLNPTIGAIETNSARIIDALASARSSRADIVLFPELAICGYPPEDLLLEPGFVDSCMQALQAISPHTKGLTAIIGLPRLAPDTQGKPLYNSAAIVVDGSIIGFHDKTRLPTYDIFDERRYFRPGTHASTWSLAGKRVGVTICEDIWTTPDCYSYDPLDEFRGIDLLINISASPYSRGKIALRRELVQQVAARLGCPVALCNQVGAQDGLIFDGSSLLSTGSQLPSFCEALGSDAQEPLSSTAELLQALVLGVRDYFGKQGFRKALVGLSGGVDSALVACIAVEALGPDCVVGCLLPSRYTSQESIDDARELATRLGISTTTLSIEQPYEAFLQLLQHSSLDLTAENLQARLRGTLLMALANRDNALLLNTSNKSELAMGYSTLYGDSCGALSVIGDLLKREVYELAAQLPIPPRILAKAPTAELRPDQKDSDTLPPYPLLDPLVDALVVRRLPCEAIANELGVSVAFVQNVAQQIHRSEYKRRQCPLALRVSDKAFSCGRRVPIVERWSC